MNIVRGRFAFHGWVGGQDDLFHLAAFESLDQVLDAQLLGPDAAQGRKRSVQHVVAAVRPGAVLDLYAGSGALAIEALSRGATRAVLVDDDRSAVAAIRANQ